MHVVKQKFLLPLTLAAVLVWSSAAAAAKRHHAGCRHRGRV